MSSAAPRYAVVLLILSTVPAVLPASAQTPTVDVSIDVEGNSARLVLTHSERVVYAIRSEEGQLAIVYAQPVRLRAGSRQMDHPILAGFRQENRETILVLTGSGYRTHEHFELHNPFRLVVDLQGSARGEGALPQMTLPSVRDPNKRVIVIDPGHGGIETGATGPTGLEEKDVTLDLARRLRRLLQRDPTIGVVLTRDEDRLIGLDERTAIANHNRADLFLSVHLNASARTTATGAETYYLSTDATDDEARTLAALENNAAGVNDPSSFVGNDGQRRDLELVLWNLAQNQYLAESAALGETMQRELNELTGTRDRGVRQAPFRVLMGATMPAILVEAGFISNPEEEERFRSFEYRSRVAEAMAAAVRAFLRDLDRLAAPAAGSSGSAGP